MSVDHGKYLQENKKKNQAMHHSYTVHPEPLDFLIRGSRESELLIWYYP